MTGGKRVYRSELRAEQARRTRAAVLDAAARCFVERGYTATTMKDVAAAAGVSVQTVFGQGGKAALMLACVDRAVVGDDESRPLIGREPVVRMMTAPTKAAKLEAVRELAVSTYPALAPIHRAFDAAAAVDPELGAAWTAYEARRHQDVHAMVESFRPWLREDLDVDRAADVAWAVLSESTADALLTRRGWTVEQYADWLADAIDRLLLR
ncbi:transcriptional regulator, TetR family [Geodermatophilus saharensis]|uniref:Transcriptional regulator, TetR family n=1 Tax=Geodermatophilus saharensis TaxID=1137994 RepID=A0A239IEQ0_9ACTN|nr:TetR/AcrR family transcriptional regulator [Geodermatophilus saharensis]SNS92110.1 transcriptional regulator, TetR family [Geodermatophilus saharensis]